MHSTHLHYYPPATPTFSKFPSRFLFIHLPLLSSSAAARHSVSWVAKKCGFRSFEILYCLHLQSRKCVTVTPIYIGYWPYILVRLQGAKTGQSVQWLGDDMDGWRIGVRFPAGVWNTVSVLQTVQMGSGKQAASYFGSDDAGVKLTSRLHLVPRLRMSGSILPFPIRFHSFHKDKFTHISVYIICIQVKHNFNFQN